MQHSFDIDIAKEFGMLEAVLLNNIWFWTEKNKANESNFYDGHYWTYNSTRAFSELFPYATPRKISNALKKLIEQGVLITGNYNKIAYDRTLWYAFTKKGECIMQKCKMEDAEMLNGSVGNVQPIPDINTNINTNINTYKEVSNKDSQETTPKSSKKSFDEIIEKYTSNIDLQEELKNHLATRKAKKGALTNRAIELSLKKLDELVINEPINEQEEMKIKIVQQSIERGYIGFFGLSNNNYNKKKINDGWDYLNEEFKKIQHKKEPMPF